jgi:hypothetical protein
VLVAGDVVQKSRGVGCPFGQLESFSFHQANELIPCFTQFVKAVLAEKGVVNVDRVFDDRDCCRKSVSVNRALGL